MPGSIQLFDAINSRVNQRKPWDAQTGFGPSLVRKAHKCMSRPCRPTIAWNRFHLGMVDTSKPKHQSMRMETVSLKGEGVNHVSSNSKIDSLHAKIR